MQQKSFLLYFLLLFVIVLSCKPKHVKPEVEPILEDSGEILYDNTWKGTLDSGTIDLSYNGQTQLVNAVVIHLLGTNQDDLRSSLLIGYSLPPETTKIPEGNFTFRGNDFYHFTVNLTKDGLHEDGGGFMERQMSFSIKKIGEDRYRIEFSGIAKDKPISGKFIGKLGSFYK